MPSVTCRAHTAMVALVVLIGGVLCAPVAAHAAVQPRIIVGFRTDTPQSAQLRAVGAVGARSIEAVPALRAQVIEVRRDQLQQTRAELLRRPDVAYAEIDYVAHAYDLGAAARSGLASAGSSNDTMRSQQWHLDTMRVDEAWQTSRGTGAVVAVLDTGVDYIHPDLAGQVDLGRDFVDGDAKPMDEEGHGTHVAGIVAAAADDGYGVAGVAPGARILAVRVLDETGAGNYSQVADGIVYAVQQGARVINLSLGGSEPSELLRSAVDYAAARGAIVTCASGNEFARAVGYPARYESCMAVGATDLTDQIADFSNRGPGLDVTAPGVQMMSTVRGSSHEAWDGTSMATPAVSGVAALLVAQGLGRREVISTIQSTAKDLGPVGVDTTYGHGRVDAAAAVAVAASLPRRLDDRTKPVVTSITAGVPERHVTTTWRTRWKLRDRGAFRRVGTSDYRGRYAYTRTVVRGRTRRVETYRFSLGVVYRRTVVYVQQRVPTEHVRSTIPVHVEASDDQAVDRVAVQVDGVVQGIDWLESGGWVIDVPCSSTARTVTASAYDVADNEASTTIRAQISC